MLRKLSLFLAVALCAVSCLKEKEVETYPQCAITAFKLGNITTRFTTVASDGSDSTYIRLIDGSTVGFNIDHLNGVIESVDSIVNWADISRVVTTINYTGYIYCKQRGWDNYYAFVSGSDSVDYTQDVEFLVVSTDGQNSRTYKAILHKAVMTADSLYWKDKSATNLTLEGNHHSVTLGNAVYVFAENGGTPTVTSLQTDDDAALWTAPAVISGVDGTLDYKSVVAFNGQFYALSSGGNLYTSTAEQGGKTWAKVDDIKMERLLCADAAYIYAYDGTAILQSADGTTWTPNGTADLDKLPQSPVLCNATLSNTNSHLQHVVMAGVANPTDAYAAVWYKVSSYDTSTNQTWSCVSSSTEEAYKLEARECLSMVSLNNQLLAFGGKKLQAGETDDAYRYTYSSTDHGLSWHRNSTKLLLPDALREAPEKAVTSVTIGDQLWLIQSGGKVWRGMIGKK